ncbi:Extracellular ligand-binding receptor [Rippkaea orientalis PCC 8801]|uniref:Extracellular ligand-binding receptor n=1 Tax=Rippkaea orientalis (strain PCC 8801 / RF-1) TaxID=41431 RepID=B7K3J0_RIPO1|nr:ABC transporter substrate-binding protein [Rippkaea orientalis]ACK65332.1 Extracellular ligand-binding receptor [Rippkaea orientalis PCC 8801]
MSQKNETSVLILSLLITAGILGVGYWWFSQKSGLKLDNLTENNPLNSVVSQSLSNRSSIGDKLLITADSTPQKKAGIEAWNQGKIEEAIAQFQASLQLQPNDPETLIYLNNAQANQKNPIKIAVVVPIGTNLNIAQEILRGVAQAQHQINQAGGINNQWLQVLIVNDDNQPELAQKLASELVKDSHILAVVGHNSSDATLAGGPIYEQGQLVMITPTSDAQKISTLGDYIFRVIPSVRFQADLLSRYTIKTAKKANIAICFDSSSEASKSLKEDFTSAIFADGGRISEINCDLAESNFQSIDKISQALEQKADSLLLLPAVNHINIAVEVAQANQGRLALLGSSTLYTFDTLKEGKDSVKGMVLTASWHPQGIPNNPFPKQAKQLWGGDINWRTALAYDATQAIITGFQQGEISRQGLQKTLANPNFFAEGATGKLQFLPSGDRSEGQILITIVPSQTNPTGFAFVPLKNN